MTMSEDPVTTLSSAADGPDEAGKQAAPASIPAAAEGLRVDISELKSSYCNVCNANITREEVVLNFGVNHDWDRAHAGQIRLLHRIALSPPAAKRVVVLLERVIRDYEARYGSLT
jgi:hypothetical protein